MNDGFVMIYDNGDACVGCFFQDVCNIENSIPIEAHELNHANDLGCLNHPMIWKKESDIDVDDEVYELKNQ